jgi:hypothetical protein
MEIMLKLFFDIIAEAPLVGLLMSGMLIAIAILLLVHMQPVTIYGDFSKLVLWATMMTLFVRCVYYGSTMLVGFISYISKWPDWQAYPQRIGENSVQVAYLLILLMAERHSDFSTRKLSPAVGIAMLLTNMAFTQVLRQVLSKELADVLAGTMGTFLNLLLWLLIANRSLAATDTTQKLD